MEASCKHFFLRLPTPCRYCQSLSEAIHVQMQCTPPVKGARTSQAVFSFPALGGVVFRTIQRWCLMSLSSMRFAGSFMRSYTEQNRRWDKCKYMQHDVLHTNWTHLRDEILSIGSYELNQCSSTSGTDAKSIFFLRHCVNLIYKRWETIPVEILSRPEKFVGKFACDLQLRREELQR